MRNHKKTLVCQKILGAIRSTEESLWAKTPSNIESAKNWETTKKTSVPILDKVKTSVQPTPPPPLLFPTNTLFLLSAPESDRKTSEIVELFSPRKLIEWRSVYQRCKNIQLLRRVFFLVKSSTLLSPVPCLLWTSIQNNFFQVLSYSCFYSDCNFFIPEVLKLITAVYVCVNF